jgi:hypothetical protein
MGAMRISEVRAILASPNVGFLNFIDYIFEIYVSFLQLILL